MSELENEFVDMCSRLFKLHGLDDLASRVVGILYLEPDEISMEEIANRTGYSLASISNTMKILENVGVVQRIKKPGTKRVFFYMEKNIVKLNIRKIDAALNNIVASLKETLPPMINKYKNRVKDEKSRQKFEIIRDYYQQLLQFEGVLNRFKKELEEITIKTRA